MLEREAKYLKNLYLEMEELAKNSSVGALLYEDEDLPVRVMRDSYGDELTAIHVGNPELYKRLLHLIKLRQDIPECKLQLYKGRRAMFQEHGISPLIQEATQPTVTLENGGYIEKDFTFQDVKFYDVIVGGKCQEGGQVFDETPYTDAEYEFGRDNLKTFPDAFTARIRKLLSGIDRYLAQPNLQDASKEDLLNRKARLEGVLSGEIK
jgi:Rne/Rng family ribonuclease